MSGAQVENVYDYAVNQSVGQLVGITNIVHKWYTLYKCSIV